MSGREQDKSVEIQCKVLDETLIAVKIETADKVCWVPKSQVTDQCDEADGTTTSIFVKEWFALEKGLI